MTVEQAPGTGSPHSVSDMCAVTAAEIAAYRRVLREAIGAAGPDVGVPQASPVYPFVLAAPTYDQVIDRLTPPGAARPVPVHLSQEVHLRGLVRPGGRVAVDLDVVAARREARGVRLAVRCVLVDDDGAVLSELVTGVLLADAVAPEPFGDLPAAPELPQGPGPVERTAVAFTIPRGAVRRYAEVSGDHNPIHLDDEAARAAGFPGVIAHGMSVLALVCEDVVDRYAGGDAARVEGVGCRFSSPVRPDEPLEIAYRTDGGPVVAFSVKTERGMAFKGGWVKVRPASGAGVGDG